MRAWLPPTLLAAAVAVYLIATGGTPTPPERPPLDPPADSTSAPSASAFDEHGAPVVPTPTFGTLVVRVLTPSGSVPTRAEVGYEAHHAVRWASAGERGQQTFTGVPVGVVYALARAPGYAVARQRREMTGGVADEAVLVLEPESGGEG